jgi:hypothetical protein
MQGDDYQARFFWLQACRLFQPHSKVIRVGYELDDVRFFDDVAAFYSEPLTDERGDLVRADYYQIKYHVDQVGAFTWKSLMDPKFVKAKSSLLQGLQVTQSQLAPEGEGCRFYIVTPWQVHPDDELARLISNQGGELRLQVLFDGKTGRSAMGKIRAAWRQHLELVDDTDLRRVLRPLRIKSNADNLHEVQERLNDRLAAVGLLPVGAQSRTSPYDDLIKKMRATGQSQFTRDELRQTCEREGLWCGSQIPIERVVQVGVRSFIRWTEYMEDETDHMLCLVRHFDNRSIRDPRLWQKTVFPELGHFLSDNMRGSSCYHLYLDAHASIAFAAGYCLHAKSGVKVTPVQKTQWGRVAWQPKCAERDGYLATWAQVDIERDSEGNDVAIALSATHDVLEDVRVYIDRSVPEVRRIVSLAVLPEPSTTVVRDGTHALALAQEVASIMRKRTAHERMGRLHIFAAAPNAVMFFLGQLARSFGRCVLYEYDFEGNAPGAYEASLVFPPEWPE